MKWVVNQTVTKAAAPPVADLRRVVVLVAVAVAAEAATGPH